MDNFYLHFLPASAKTKTLLPVCIKMKFMSISLRKSLLFRIPTFLTMDGLMYMWLLKIKLPLNCKPSAITYQNL